MSAQDPLDQWLDVALGDYGDVEVPLGFELRTMGRLREVQLNRHRVWTFGFASASVLAITLALIFLWPQHSITNLPRIPTHIAVPQIAKVGVVPTVRIQKQTAHRASTRGVPIVAAPLTRQEEAILRVLHNARARQLAFLPPASRDLTQEQDPLDIQELDIPPIMKREQK